MTTVFAGIPSISVNAGKCGVLPSSNMLASPLVNGANHLLGFKLTGLLHLVNTTVDQTGTGRFMTYRHPNCDYLVACIYATAFAATGTALDSVTFQAGSGAATIFYVPMRGVHWIAFPWGGSGWQEVTYTITGKNGTAITSVAIWSAARTDLDTSDICFEAQDPDYLRAGMDPSQYIITNSATTHMVGLAGDISSAKTYGIRQAVSWCPITGSLDVASGTYTNPFGTSHTFTFRHQARRFKAGDTATSRNYRVYLRTYFSANLVGDTYSWKVFTSSGGSVEKTGLNRTALTEGWDYLDNLTIDCTDVDQITCQLKRVPAAGGTPTVKLTGLSICEIPT